MTALARRRPAVAGRTARDRRGIFAEPLLWVLVAGTAAADAAASIVRHANFGTGFDLALADQVVWRYSHFLTPYSSIEGQNILGDHFSPLVAVLSPLYWMWSNPRTLLIAQAVLVAASIVPVFWFARPRLGRAGAYLVAAGYATFWGLQVGVLFDFHELAFAPLLIGVAILAADRRRWAVFWAAIVLLLLVKEDLSLLVVAFGIWRLSHRDWRRAAILVALGIGWYALTTVVLIPGLGRGAGYGHWTYGQLGRTSAQALWAVLRAPWKLFQIGLSPSLKVHTMAALFGAFLFLSVGSRLVILALPLLAERFLSSDALLWGTHYHYSLAIAPVLAMAAVSTLARLGRRLGTRRRNAAILGAAAALLAVNLAMTVIAIPDSALGSLVRSSLYQAPRWSSGLPGALARLPPSASLITEATVLPQVSERSVLGLVDPKSVGVGEYVLVNLAHPDCCDLLGNAGYTQLDSVIDSQLPDLTPVYFADGWLLGRRSPPGHPGNGVLLPLPGAQARTVRRTAAAWRRSLTESRLGFERCTPMWIRAGAAAAPCYARAIRALDVDQHRLSRVLAGLRSRLYGGCAELGALAASRTARLTADIDSAVASIADGSRAALERAGRRYQTDETVVDPEASLNRFVLLCTSR